MNEGLLLRLAQPADAQAIADIYNQHIKIGMSTMDMTLKSAADILTWLDEFDEREVLLVLEKRTSVLGWGIIKRYSEREGYKYACETAVYLKSEHIGKGYGTFIKKEIIKYCRKFEYHHLVAKIFSVNESSIHYNQKLGYEIVGTQKEIGFVAGEWMDVTIMQLIID
jgi:phosphinothricin acetyltransferase